MGSILKVFIESVTILLLFCVFGHEACGILASQPGIELAPLALEDQVLTTGPPGKWLAWKSLQAHFYTGCPRLYSIESLCHDFCNT